MNTLSAVAFIEKVFLDSFLHDDTNGPTFVSKI